ncbi:class II aldolase/adducin family protein [Kribbella sp. NPDC050820]|uniref:class II aldolase/adducin family protein n=1 Tax=Kribbella sp. NPDC050820 TaxID=3155408 RepID=UPI0033DC8E7A
MAEARTVRAPAEEREVRLRELAVTFRILARRGLDEGAGGHVTARDPEYPDRFWINPFGQPFGTVCVRDLLLVDQAGNVVKGNGRVNPAGYAIHSQLHAGRPDVIAAVHTHSTYGRAWSSLGRPLDPITQDACAFFGDHAVHRDFPGVVLEAAEAKRIAATLSGMKAVILQNHGLLTVGRSVGEAAWWFVLMDKCCQIQLLAESAGRPIPVPVETAQEVAGVMGVPSMGRLNFRSLYAEIVADSPDLLR